MTAGLQGLPTLRAVVSRVTVTPTVVSVPRPGLLQSFEVPGPVEYDVDLRGLMKTESDFLVWRELAGTQLEVVLPPNHCLTAECGSCWACHARGAMR